jgi:hypothetical protein
VRMVGFRAVFVSSESGQGSGDVMGVRSYFGSLSPRDLQMKEGCGEGRLWEQSLRLVAPSRRLVARLTSERHRPAVQPDTLALDLI